MLRFAPLRESSETQTDHPSHTAAPDGMGDHRENRPQVFLRVDTRPDTLPNVGSFLRITVTFGEDNFAQLCIRPPGTPT
jgi:hypothetical protein